MFSRLKETKLFRMAATAVCSAALVGVSLLPNKALAWSQNPCNCPPIGMGAPIFFGPGISYYYGAPGFVYPGGFYGPNGVYMINFGPSAPMIGTWGIAPCGDGYSKTPVVPGGMKPLKPLGEPAKAFKEENLPK